MELKHDLAKGFRHAFCVVLIVPFMELKLELYHLASGKEFES